jgi:anti-anti-sigma factor
MKCDYKPECFASATFFQLGRGGSIMASPRGTIRVCQSEQKTVFHIEGWAQMDLGLALRRAAEQGLAQGTTSLLVDLRQCEYMDSTFMGTLLYLKRAADRRSNIRFALIAPSQPCCQLLEQMGLLDVFPAASCEEIPGEESKPLCRDISDVEAFQRNVLQAHEELACLPGKAAEPFKKLARMMAQEMDAKKPK